MKFLFQNDVHEDYAGTKSNNYPSTFVSSTVLSYIGLSKTELLFELMGAVANEFELVVHAGPTLLEMIKLQCHIYIRHGLSNI